VDGDIAAIVGLLCQRRRDLNLPVKVVARRIGVSHHALRKWQTARRSPRLVDFVAWCAALNVALAIIPRK
jgi:transcriptional regulator with XRE-family HTH domain